MQINENKLKEEFGNLATSLSDEMQTAISNWWLEKLSLALTEYRKELEERVEKELWDCPAKETCDPDTCAYRDNNKVVLKILNLIKNDNENN